MKKFTVEYTSKQTGKVVKLEFATKRDARKRVFVLGTMGRINVSKPIKTNY